MQEAHKGGALGEEALAALVAGYQKEHGLRDLAGRYIRPHMDAGLELLAESKVQSEQRAAEKAAGKAAAAGGEEPSAKKAQGARRLGAAAWLLLLRRRLLGLCVKRGGKCLLVCARGCGQDVVYWWAGSLAELVRWWCRAVLALLCFYQPGHLMIWSLHGMHDAATGDSCPQDAPLTPSHPPLLPPLPCSCASRQARGCPRGQARRQGRLVRRGL